MPFTQQKCFTALGNIFFAHSPPRQPFLGGVGANKNVSPPDLPKRHVNSRGSSLTRQRLPENTHEYC